MSVAQATRLPSFVKQASRLRHQSMSPAPGIHVVTCVTLLIVTFAVVPAPCAAAAAPPSSAQKDELRQLRLRIEALQKRLAASEETKIETADALRESERAISETNRILREPGFKPERDYVLDSIMVTPGNAARMYEQFTVPGMN